MTTLTNPTHHPGPSTVPPTSVAPIGRATYTIAEVCALLGISRATAYAMLRAGEIPARRLGSRWIIPRHRLDVWLNAEPVAHAASPWEVRP